METKHTEQYAKELAKSYWVSEGKRCAFVEGYLKAIDESAAPELLEALEKAHEELKSIIRVLDGRISPEFAKTDLGMRLVSFFKSNAFICEEKLEPVIKKAKGE